MRAKEGIVSENNKSCSSRVVCLVGAEAFNRQDNCQEKNKKRFSYALFFFLMPSLARLIQTLEDKGASLVLSTEQWTASQHTAHQGEG